MNITNIFIYVNCAWVLERIYHEKRKKYCKIKYIRKKV